MRREAQILFFLHHSFKIIRDQTKPKKNGIFYKGIKKKKKEKRITLVNESGRNRTAVDDGHQVEKQSQEFIVECGLFQHSRSFAATSTTVQDKKKL